MFIYNDNSDRIINSYNKNDNLHHEYSRNLIMNKNKLSHVKSLSGFLYFSPVLNDKIRKLPAYADRFIPAFKMSIQLFPHNPPSR